MDSKRIQHIKNQFDNAISRAVDSCEISEIEVANHFREVTKMISLGKGGKRIM